ncbi:MAG: hypothetical protein J5653_09950 [Clostridiales bacterium]|nr:hypothetical protein [Clostridiales bacterium]
MSKCIFCGNETGGTEFCQSCGAKVEGALIAQEAPVEEQVETPEVITPERMDPQDTPGNFYKPQAATGILAANIVVLVLAVALCVHTIGITILAMIFSIIGIINASKVKSAQSEFEAQHRKSTATVMFILGLVALFIGFAVYLILSLLRVVTKNIFGFFSF